MHEYALVRALLQHVETAARAHRATAAQRVVVRIGALAGVERALFASAYAHCRAGTICARAELVIAAEDVLWRCAACGASIVNGRALTCAMCGGAAELAAGDALVLERIDLEVPGDV
jgi:hydrogenase nickel incorporation protein HypA/HybF